MIPSECPQVQHLVGILLCHVLSIDGFKLHTQRCKKCSFAFSVSFCSYKTKVVLGQRHEMILGICGFVYEEFIEEELSRETKKGKIKKEYYFGQCPREGDCSLVLLRNM